MLYGLGSILAAALDDGSSSSSGPGPLYYVDVSLTLVTQYFRRIFYSLAPMFCLYVLAIMEKFGVCCRETDASRSRLKFVYECSAELYHSSGRSLYTNARARAQSIYHMCKPHALVQTAIKKDIAEPDIFPAYPYT